MALDTGFKRCSWNHQNASIVIVGISFAMQRKPWGWPEHRSAKKNTSAVVPQPGCRGPL